MKRKILTTLAVLSLSAAAGGTFAAPSYAAATSQSTPVAFNGPDGPFCSTLWTWNGVAGESSFDASPGFLPANCIGMLAGTSPSEVALANGDVVVAFQGINGDLWTWEGVPGNVGTAVDHDLGMMPGTSPAIGPGGDGIAFQANTGVLWTWSGSPTTLGVGTSTGLGMAPDTSPSYSTYALTVFGFNDQLRAVAFQGGNHDLWTWDDNGTADTGLGMAPGTSPSITTSTAENTVNVAFEANGGTLWTWTGTPATRGFGANTDLPMNAGTSPSIIPYSDGGGGDVAVAFQADGGLWTWYGVAGGDAIRYFSDGLGNMAAGTSPSITALANGQTAAAFQQDNGALWTWTGTPGTIGFAVGTGCANNACAGGGLPMASATSPSIVAAILPPHGLSLTPKGNLLAQLLKPRTLVLLVYSTAKRHGHRRLLGRVALGDHPAGLSRITWGVRVHGHRLGAGDYLVELEARIDGLLTIGGPTVRFDVGQSGKLTILAQSSPA